MIQPPYFPVLSIEEVEGRKLIVLWAPGGQNRPYKAPEAITAKHKVWKYFIRRYSSTVEAKGEAEQELLRRPCKIHLAAPTRSAGRARVASRFADAASADSSQSERKKAGAMPRRAMARSSQRMLKPAAHNTACSASPSAPLSQQRFMP